MYSQFIDFDDHELITIRQDLWSGLSAVIAVHNSALGPAIGGCRMLNYSTQADAVTDVLRLSRGMTYKSAIAKIPYGGGKAVIIGDPRHHKTSDLLHAMGDFVDSLKGRYITSFDTGTTLDDVKKIGENTAYTAGTLPGAGNASRSTAYGVFCCMKTAIKARLGSDDFDGVHVAIEGLGNVGSRLANFLHAEGAILTVADVNSQACAAMTSKENVRVVSSKDIHKIDADIFAPCALGGGLSEARIAEMKAPIIVGAANNQLAHSDMDAILQDKGILYCPDYLANAGGIIDLHHQRSGWDQDFVSQHVEGLAESFQEVIEQSKSTGEGTGTVTDRIARGRFIGAGGRA